MDSTLPRLLRIAAAFAALAASTAASATYVFNTVSYPGSVMTDVRGLNGTGRIVGYASIDGVNNFAFSYAGGVFSLLPPAAVPLTAHGINDAGVIVGSTFEDPSPTRGFILSGGTYTLFSRPGWPNTHARAIGASGLVTGYSDDGGSASSGFIYNPATTAFTDITIPGSVLTIAQGINNAGQVVGSAVLPGGAQAFLRQPDGTILLFQIGGNPTRARGITDTGLMTGFVTIGGATSGFVGDSLGYQLLDVPGATQTVGEAINNAGQVSGLYTDGPTGATRGFIATPVSMPTGTTSGGAYVFSVQVIPGVPIFIDPAVAVGYDYRIGEEGPAHRHGAPADRHRRQLVQGQGRAGAASSWPAATCSISAPTDSARAWRSSASTASRSTPCWTRPTRRPSRRSSPSWTPAGSPAPRSRSRATPRAATSASAWRATTTRRATTTERPREERVRARPRNDQRSSKVEQHRLVVGKLRVEVDADLAHARRQVLAHEDEIAAVGLLRVAVVVHAEGRVVRAPAVHERPGVAIGGPAARERPSGSRRTRDSRAGN